MVAIVVLSSLFQVVTYIDVSVLCYRFLIVIDTFPISRNTGFVFPSGLSVPVPVPGQKIQEQEWLRHFPDRSRPFSSLPV